MANATRFFDFREHAFAWALALSVALHAVLAATLPPFRFETPKREKALDVELAPPPKAETPPPLPVEPPKPEVVKPKPQVRPNPVPAPLPRQVQQVQQVQAVSEPAPAPRVESAQQPPPPPAVIAAAPKAEEPPAFVAPPPEPPKPTGPSQQDIDAARNNYRNLLARAFDKHRQYPRLAQMRGWEGTVRLQLELDANGNITSSTVIESSGFEVLDKQALETARKASPLPPPPDPLRNRPFSIMVPVTFRLE